MRTQLLSGCPGPQSGWDAVRREGPAARPPDTDSEPGLGAGTRVVFLMESNPRGLYIFSFNLGHFVSLSENIT